MRGALLVGALLAIGGVTRHELVAQSGPHRTRNVILITLDGVRWQELFTGMDSTISADTLSGVYDLERLQRDYWRPTPEARRRALMPFFWDSLVPRGVLLGDRNRGSLVSITNPHGFSAPGYQEILTGQYQTDVTTNDSIRYPHQTSLEYARQALGLGKMQVTVFGSWENFRFYAASRADAVYVNAGNDAVPEPFTTPLLTRLASLQTRALALWEGSRLDAFTGAIGLEYIRRHQPRVVYFAFNDTDDLAHARRYDSLLDALHSTDDFLRELWQTVQSLPAYRDHTSLIITTDHGRGRSTKDWDDHGGDVPGSEEIWVAVIGPDTPRHGAANGGGEVHQADVAATMLGLLGLEAAKFNPAAGPAIPGVGAGR
jgi:hypothetical protein